MEETSSQPPSFLYETLGALSFSVIDQSPPPSSDDLEPYSVFRNEISLSTLPYPNSDAAATAPDFFSLYASAADDDGRNNDSGPIPASPAPARRAEPKTPAPDEEPRLESGWFRGNSKFKSPMLQLHKGTGFWKELSFNYWDIRFWINCMVHYRDSGFLWFSISNSWRARCP